MGDSGELFKAWRSGTPMSASFFGRRHKGNSSLSLLSIVLSLAVQGAQCPFQEDRIHDGTKEETLPCLPKSL